MASEVARFSREQLDEADIDAREVVRELARIAKIKLTDFYDERGNVKPMSEWTPAMAASVAQVEIVIKNAEAGDGHTDRVLKLKLWDKPKVLELLGKRFNLFKEQVEIRGDLVFTWAK